VTLPLNSTYTTEDLDATVPSVFKHAPLLAPLLVFSLIVHAAVIGFWPDAAVVIAAPMTAARVAVQVQHNVTGNHYPNTQPSPTTQAQTTLAPAVQQHPKSPKGMLTKARTFPRSDVATHTISPSSASHHDTADITGKTSPVASTSTQGRDSTAADDGDALRKRLNGSLQCALIAHFDYPPVARRRGWEGVVQVGLRVEANGQLSRLRLVATSGHALLDRAALHSLGRVGRLPEAMDWLQGRQLDMILPVRYQLIDS